MQKEKIVYGGEFLKRYMENAEKAGFPVSSKAQANRDIANVFDTIEDILVNDRRPVSRQGFGKFEIRHRGARRGRNPQTGEEIELPATTTVGFKIGKHLKEEIVKAKA